MTDYLRGFFWIQPWPHHAAGRRWMRGKDASCTLIFLSVPAAIFGAGFVAGRYF
jgi:hypothetical protein